MRGDLKKGIEAKFQSLRPSPAPQRGRAEGNRKGGARTGLKYLSGLGFLTVGVVP
jgi:hypothetical protein